MEFLYKCIYLLGESIRNPSLKIHRKALMKTDFLDIVSLKELQIKRLRILLQHARNNSDYYKEALKNIDIDEITLDNLSLLPILKKDVLITNMQKIQNTPINEKMFESATSASTGDALKFSRNQNWDAATRAAQFRGYSWYGVKPWMKNIYFWGYNPKLSLKLKMRFLDFLMNRYRIFSYDDKVLRSANRYLKGSSYIEGYSSSIFTLAQYFKKNSIQFDKIKMVKGTSEKIKDYYQSTIKEVFGTKMISEYGATESGLIAFECPHGNMHITMENVIIEEVDKKLLVTNLFSHAVPMIRYELGDYVELDTTTQCSCGRQHYIVKEITGRLGFQVYGFEKIYPSLSINYIFKNIAQLHDFSLAYFCTQNEKGLLHVRLMYDGDAHDEIKNLVIKEANELYADDIVIEIEFVKNIEHKNKKSHCFESYVTL